MNHAKFFALLGGVMIGCAPLPPPELVQPTPAPAGSPVVQEPHTSGQPQAPEQMPSSMRLVAITEATDFALQPRVLHDDEVVVPLPAERAHLARVEVGLLVTRRDTGEIMDQQKKSFRWDARCRAAFSFAAAPRWRLPRRSPDDLDDPHNDRRNPETGAIA